MSGKIREGAERPLTELDSTNTIARRHKVSVKTIDRWTQIGILPQPMRINGRKFWPADTVAKTDDASP
jgi:predicted site-specific integrase-resolvase